MVVLAVVAIVVEVVDSEVISLNKSIKNIRKKKPRGLTVVPVIVVADVVAQHVK